MRIKTHLLLGIFVAIYFLPFVENKIVFFPIVIFASIIPNIDTIIFPKKNYKILKPFKSESYKNFMHSYTFCILFSLILAFFYPLLAFPFFLGYSFHLFFDSLTVSGTYPFWPANVRSQGPIHRGGKLEKVIGVALIFSIFILIAIYVYGGVGF